jgi:hypothetical protein
MKQYELNELKDLANLIPTDDTTKNNLVIEWQKAGAVKETFEQELERELNSEHPNFDTVTKGAKKYLEVMRGSKNRQS